MIDKDRPKTWVRYKLGMCDSCWATCCTMPVEITHSDLVRLGWADPSESLKEISKRLLREKKISKFRQATGKFTLSRQSDGSCDLLTKDRRCSVYENRPETCRNFPQVSSRAGYCPALPKESRAR